MPEINLLPIELSPSRGSYKVATTLKKVSYGLAGFFLFIALLGVIFIVYLTAQINTSVNNQNALKQRIQALEGTEQKIFLIKDRTDKIKSANSYLLNVDSPFEQINKSLGSLPSTVSVNSIEINTTESKFSVLSTDSLGMASFLNSIVASGVYKGLTLTGFIFSPDRGYLISFGVM